MAEVVMAAIQPYPFLLSKIIPNYIDSYCTTGRRWFLVDIRYEINDLLLLPIFIRSYVFLRFLMALSWYYNYRVERIL
jgi:hypothetical protein